MPTLAFLLDVDNTLLNNDHVKEIWDERLDAEAGPELAAHFWDIYEQVRREEDVVDIPLALTRFREETPLTTLDELTYLHICALFDDFPFAQELFPHALETLDYLRTLGVTVILSDGDLYFQAKKISHSGLAEMVGGRILLYVHKQEHLDEIMSMYPADHYVMVDDKPTVLADTKAILGNRLTTVFVEQGKYAKVPPPEHFVPDIALSRIGDLRYYGAEQFFHPHQ
ncbi:MAG: HAD family hydrolase [Ktedonobacteraceae bacterium]